MDAQEIGTMIQRLREQQNLTQKALAERLAVSDKTISKWETGRGLPDMALFQPLAEALQVSVSELFSGVQIVNQNRSGNLKKMGFYVCPICGNVLYSMGEGVFSCCGISLPKLQAEPATDTHALTIQQVEYDYVVSMEHPMEKTHFLSFFAYVTSDRISFIKCYPEQNSMVRFPMMGHGTIYSYCNRHGLFQVSV